MHDIEVVTKKWITTPKINDLSQEVNYALEIGRGRCLLLLPQNQSFWFSTRRADPLTGEAFPELEPSLLSWNSPRGWCTFCRGYGRIYDWMKEDLPASGDWWKLSNGKLVQPVMDKDWGLLAVIFSYRALRASRCLFLSYLN